MIERLIRIEKGDDYDEKWDRFPPEFWFNDEQSPCLFMFNSNRTYHQITEDQNNEKLRISKPGEGFDKKQYSLKRICSPQGKQPPLKIRGAGKRISKNERSSWYKDVHVFF